MRYLAPSRAARGRLASAAVAAALVVTVLGFSAVDRSANAVAYPQLTSATLEFEADGLSGTTGNAVEIAGEITDLTTETNGFETVSIPISTQLLRSGRVDVAFLAGNAGTEPEEGYDDYLIRDPRLALADGSAIFDERYTAGRAYHVGDGISPDDPDDSTASMNQTGHLISDTEEVLRRELRFLLPAISRSSADAPEVPNVEQGSGSEVEVGVSDPDGDSVDVQVMAADEAELLSARAGEGYVKPHEETPGSTTVELPLADGSSVAELDGNSLETSSSQGFPTQEFTMKVDPEQVSGLPHLDVEWQGQTSPGRGATLYVRDLVHNVWADVASIEDADEGATLAGAIDVASTVAEDGTIRLQVQEERFTTDESDFSIAWMTDTQFLSERFPQIYDSMNEWIVDSAEEENIIYTVHTGDITQNYNSRQWEWPRASESMAILEDADMPYGIVTGNHDIAPEPFTDPLSHIYYDQYFPASRFEGWETDHFKYGGHFGGNNRNHYDLINYGGEDFLFLYLDWAAGDPEIAWANQVLKAHPDHYAVLNTHQYINPAGAYTKDGAKFFEQLVVPNDNVFMFLCGHHSGAAYNIRRIPLPDGGTRIMFEVLHDYQSGPDGGSGYLRLLRFDLDALQMDQQPYSPYTDDFDYAAEKNGGGIPEEHDDYTASLQLGTYDRELATDRIAVLVRTGEVVAQAEDVESGDEETLDLPDELPAALVVRLTDPSGAVAEAPAHVTS